MCTVVGGLVLFIAACSRTIDVRARLLESARVQDPDFPDGRDVKLTRFAYLGNVETSEGTIYIVDRSAVITGMRAPRGLHRIDFFDRNFHLQRSVTGSATPLWCEGSKIYCWGFGYLWSVPFDREVAAMFPDDEQPTGNVIDLSNGVAQMVMRREKEYGSSGGIEDNPLNRP